MPQKSADKNRNIFLSVAQGRHGDAHDVQAKEKIVPKFSLADKLFEILVCGGNQPYVRAQRLIAADALESAFLADNAQQFDLRAGTDFGHFVEENGTTARLLKSTDTALMRPGECA